MNMASIQRYNTFRSLPSKGLYKGFSLIEMLVVVGIISLLAGFVYTSIAPSVQLNKAHNTNRRNGNLQYGNAISQYTIDTLPLTGVPEGIANAKDICRIHLQRDACTNPPVNGYDLSALEPDYLTPLPVDAVEADANITGYRVYRENQFIRVCNTRLDAGC